MRKETGLWLVHRARGVIRSRLYGYSPTPPPTGGPEELFEYRACFVTLTLEGCLRGCIGSLEGWRPLWKDCEENALAAAFQDPRFPPLSPGEEPHILVEVSVLSSPRPLGVNGPRVLEHLEPGIHGVILSCRGHRSTFLPQVWEQIPDRKEFLEHLSRKAGLEPAAWESPGSEFLVYTVEKWREVES